MRNYKIKIFETVKHCIPWFLQKGGVSGKWIKPNMLNWATPDGQSWGVSILEKHLSWLRCLIAPIQVLCDRFTQLVQDAFYRFSITGQVIYLEHLLNDNLDNVDRRITITDGSLILPPNIYYSTENGEEKQLPLTLYTDDEYNRMIVFFVINIPIEIEVTDAFVKSLIAPYKRSGAQFKINRYEKIKNRTGWSSINGG